MIKKKLKVNFKDKRGSITDIFYKKNIRHVAIIKSKTGVKRGDHFHKKTLPPLKSLSIFRYSNIIMLNYLFIGA